jgi:7-keto-8-aminopelargonate synthetase-like enzyme
MSKTRTNKFIDTIDECLTNGVKNGIFQVSLQDDSLNGRNVTIDGKTVVNFGSCSYLGLEVDERLKQGAIDATLRYGTQYSASRAFSACPLYEELEELLVRIFDNNPSILAATTTLTHVAAVPILVQDDDLVILDHQVHGSVQMAAQLVKAKGTKVEMIRHNRMDILEDLIKVNPNKYNKIWYMADGLYSMYGDYAPLKDLTFLMEKYHNFHVYIDDAHGMSWIGKHGNGYVLSQGPLHPKMILSTSLAKGFGTGGGVLVITDKEMKRKILTCGSSYTFSGPVQPPMLGASIASAKIHLTDEIYSLQQKLVERIEFTHKTIQNLGLPSIAPSTSPIFYLGLGLPRVGYNMVKRLLNEGFYANIGIFPAVPVKCSGLRLPITNGLTHDDIRNMLEAFKYHFPRVLEEERITIENISRSFNDPLEETKKAFSVSTSNKEESQLEVQHETTIHNIDKQLWDDLLGDNGTFDWEGCRFLEETFQDNEDKENNWKFHYLIIRDHNKKIVLATFFSELLYKDDMISSASTSQQIEEVRKKDKYFLTSKVVMLGSLISVGNHLYINKNHSRWQVALRKLSAIMNDVKQSSGSTAVYLRDFDTEDMHIKESLIKEGFVRVDMPDDHILQPLDWEDEAEYSSRMSSADRWHFKRKILDNKKFFSVSILNGEAKRKSIKEWYTLYFNVKQKSFNINTFALPHKYFLNMIDHPNWEIIELRLKGDSFSADEVGKLVSVGFCYKSSKNNYSMVAVGLDYNYVYSHGCYRQALYQSVVRAHFLQCNRVYLGMDASIEKQRFGVSVIRKSVYIQANDNFNMELIGNVYSNMIAYEKA